MCDLTKRSVRLRHSSFFERLALGARSRVLYGCQGVCSKGDPTQLSTTARNLSGEINPYNPDTRRENFYAWRNPVSAGCGFRGWNSYNNLHGANQRTSSRRLPANLPQHAHERLPVDRQLPEKGRPLAEHFDRYQLVRRQHCE